MQRLVPVAAANSSRLIGVNNLLFRSSQSSRRALSSSIIFNRNQNRSTEVNQHFQINSNNLLSSKPYYEASTLYIQKSFYASYPSHTKIRLPALSPTMEQGTIAKWVKKEGDQILEGDLVAEIETDKATMGLEASDEGYLAKILIPEKTKDIALKTLLCIVVKDKSDIAAFANFKPSDDTEQPSAPAEAAPAQPAPAPPAPTPVQQPVVAPRPATPTPPPPPPTPAPTSSTPAPKPAGGRVFATPLARKLAAERNIDLSLVQASGPDNQIRANDVLNYTAATPAKEPVAVQSQNYEDVALNNFRAVTAKRLLQSKQTIPHYYLTIDLEIDNALKVRKDLNEQLAKDNMKVSLNDLVIKAAALACKRVPEANSAWMDTFIRKHNNVDVCVAVATENGLITPIVFNADKKGLSSISFDVNSLAQKARANKLKPHEFQGGTFTVSNLGMFGIKHFAAVINPPQSCILAVGGSDKRVVPDEKGGHRVATYMTVTLSCDHRVVDGAVGAKWLEKFKQYMENPASMLL